MSFPGIAFDGELPKTVEIVKRKGKVAVLDEAVRGTTVLTTYFSS